MGAQLIGSDHCNRVQHGATMALSNDLVADIRITADKITFNASTLSTSFHHLKAWDFSLAVSSLVGKELPWFADKDLAKLARMKLPSQSADHKQCARGLPDYAPPFLAAEIFDALGLQC